MLHIVLKKWEQKYTYKGKRSFGSPIFTLFKILIKLITYKLCVLLSFLSYSINRSALDICTFNREKVSFREKKNWSLSLQVKKLKITLFIMYLSPSLCTIILRKSLLEFCTRICSLLFRFIFNIYITIRCAWSGWIV